ncbi:MAG: hypothetical protein K9L95_06245 [Candidatus Omnitrophica bacterium]|nr:hypothetical protein [Candidatus Omnitrophota bacterium]MCF7877687.1 hypothetical protein [Candidatus Omnitrophota bacterium]MCF7879046.1 hypothetical protein [Candidatus Omnitrophota bacterium]
MKKNNKKQYKYSPIDWPVSAEELRSRYLSCRKEENRVSVIWIILFFMFLFGCVAIGKFIDQLSRGLEIAFIIIFMGILGANLFFIFKTIKDRMRDYGLVCPNCKKVFNVRLINYILNTGCCYKCRTKLIK